MGGFSLEWDADDGVKVATLRGMLPKPSFP
jgi:hypothetical protein